MCCFLVCIFTFRFPCCDVRYNFRIKTMFGSSLPPVVCRRADVLFTLFVFVCVSWCLTHIELCLFFMFVFVLSCVPYVASFSGLSVFDCPLRYSLTFIYRNSKSTKPYMTTCKLIIFSMLFTEIMSSRWALLVLPCFYPPW